MCRSWSGHRGDIAAYLCHRRETSNIQNKKPLRLYLLLLANVLPRKTAFETSPVAKLPPVTAQYCVKVGRSATAARENSAVSHAAPTLIL